MILMNSNVVVTSKQSSSELSKFGRSFYNYQPNRCSNNQNKIERHQHEI